MDIVKRVHHYNNITKNVFTSKIDHTREKYYVCSMFPYPSGSSMHIGHPVSYIAADIISRYKKAKGFNVINPIGFDSFGVPTEQYAIDVQKHPTEVTTENIEKFRAQFAMITCSFHWDREVITSDFSYYKWTQWIFAQMYNSWYDITENRARSIDDIEVLFSTSGNINVRANTRCVITFDSIQWMGYSDREKRSIIADYRMIYIADYEVNWVPEMGTAVSNDEVKGGYTERGGYKVERKNVPQWYVATTAYSDRIKDMSGVDYPQGATNVISRWVEDDQYRDAVFSRQRYWGEPIPIKWVDGEHFIDDNPVEHPYIDDFMASDGKTPMQKVPGWEWDNNTMPSWAGSSWYFMRYCDPNNDLEFASRESTDYWNSVDYYIGGVEHSVGHIIYARIFTKFMFDRGFISYDEPFKKWVGQGMVWGKSRIIKRVVNENRFISYEKSDGIETSDVYVWGKMFIGDTFSIENFKAMRKEYTDFDFTFDVEFMVEHKTEKMSKSKRNVVNPDDIIKQYGSDAFRIYTMFMSPIEHKKEWDSNGVKSMAKFINRVYAWYYDNDVIKAFSMVDDPKEVVTFSKFRESVERNIDQGKFNVAISQYMVFIKNGIKSDRIRREFIQMFSWFAPVISEWIWKDMGESSSIYDKIF